MQIGIGDCIAFLALLLSGINTWKAIKFNSRQQSLIASQESLNQRLLQREDKEEREARQAVLSAAFIKRGKSWMLKVGNKGQSLARNVRMTVIAGNESFIESDVQSKFPMLLHPHQSVDLTVFVGLNPPSKYEILFVWDDDNQSDNEMKVCPTL